jgi:hypothetical protein
MKDLTPQQLEQRFKQNDRLEEEYQGSYPPSCDNCPNNPDNYEFNDKYVKELGGNEDNTL